MAGNDIKVIDAYKNNLKHVSINLPKYKIIVFTGASGSGKSSMVLDTIAAQSRRELNDTFSGFVQQYLPKYGRPEVEKIENLPVAIVIDQKKPLANQRSTVGTYTDTYTLLRLLFSRIGEPFIGYSDKFSFNHPQGSCPRCDGLGEITELDVQKLVDFNKSLNETGVINYIAFEPGQWRWIRYACSGLFDLDKKIKDYSEEELYMLLYSPQMRLENPGKGWPKTAKYEGLVTRMYRSVLNSEEGKRHNNLLKPMIKRVTCPVCNGARLNQQVLSCRINGYNIAEVTAFPLQELLKWLESIESYVAADIKEKLGIRVKSLINIGLGYLTLDRGLNTLSGGEIQRCKIAKYLNSSLSDVLYILDEPSVGLHSHDIHRLIGGVEKLRDGGNTVILVEHHKQMIEIADYIIDMGPGAGQNGGRILYEGSYQGLLESGTLTGELLKKAKTIKPYRDVRQAKGVYRLRNMRFHNLKNVDVTFPLGVLAVIIGVAGSGKSSLMDAFYNSIERDVKDGTVTFSEPPIYINQKNIGGSLRATPATYIGVAEDIRKIFSKESGKKQSLFSFNGDGKCPVCQGKGVVISKMAFMDTIETTCEACQGLRYSEQALSHQVDGYNIAQVMDFTVNQALDWLSGTSSEKKLRPLVDVGLGYLHLNQALSTLSGGELQRLKLASYLNTTGKIFIIDEPTDGLHLGDVDPILGLFEKMVDAGNSIFLIEHNLEIIKSADYVIELGPGGGEDGGKIIFSGNVEGLLKCENSVTAKYL